MISDKKRCNKGTDRISNLPDDIIENILLRLPLRDAVRTSTLSHRWRYQWNTLPDLVFDSDYMSIPDTIGQEEIDNKLVTIVDQVLLLHQGPVRKFKLSTTLERDVDIDRWILFLSRNGIKEIVLYKRRGKSYNVPSRLFLCEDITHLTLFQCIVISPASFRGFESLSILYLESVTISNEALEFMISHCPMMKKLFLRHIDGCDHLNICAKELVYLAIQDRGKEVCFKSCPLLATAYIKLSIGEDQVLEDGDISKLVDIFGSLPKIEMLELRDGSLKVFTSGNVPPRLPHTHQLHYLAIDLNFCDMQEMLGVFSLFRSSPVLQDLNIKAFSEESTSRISSEGFWEAQQNFNCLFSQLRVIEIKNLKGTRSELKFIEFVLAKAPVLEAMGIRFRCLNDNVQVILKKMIRFRRVSPKAEVVFMS